MTLDDALLLGVLAWLAAHHPLLGLPIFAGRAAPLILVQVINLLIISGLLTWGLPSLVGQLKVFNWIVALLFVLHTWQNTARFQAQRAARRASQDEAEGARRRAIAAALAAGEAPREP